MVCSKEIVREMAGVLLPSWPTNIHLGYHVFERCYTDTLDNTVEILEDSSTFVLTDIYSSYLITV